MSKCPCVLKQEPEGDEWLVRQLIAVLTDLLTCA